MIIKTYLSTRFRFLALLAAFLSGVGVTIFSWWVGLICLLIAAAMDFLSFFLGRRADVADAMSPFTDLLSRFGQQ